NASATAASSGKTKIKVKVVILFNAKAQRRKGAKEIHSDLRVFASLRLCAYSQFSILTVLRILALRLWFEVQVFRQPVHHPVNAVPHESFAKVDHQPELQPCQSQIGQQ